MKEQIKKWAFFIAELFVAGFVVSFGMCLCALLFDTVG